MIEYNKIQYSSLNAKQKEIYNFQKLAALLADYGFNCIKLSDDWNGADLIANHIDGKTSLKIQLKARLTFDKKYQNKELYIAFPYLGDWFLYPHDELLAEIKGEAQFTKGTNDSWNLNGKVSWGKPTAYFSERLEKYKVTG